jgi:hypothetical protein
MVVIPAGNFMMGSPQLRCGLDRTAWSDASSWPEATDHEKREKTVQISVVLNFLGVSLPKK